MPEMPVAYVVRTCGAEVTYAMAEALSVGGAFGT